MKGRCHCGEVTYTVQGEPFWVGACHCVDCRQISGNPYTVFVGYRVADFQLTKGHPKEYASSPDVTRSFCGTCSSPITWQKKDADKLFVSVGTLEHPESFTPEKHIWAEQKLPWVTTD